MNKSYRIKTKVNPNKTNNIKIKLEQEVDQFQILSLKIDQKNDYNNFNCNHGVLVGRVIANGGVGIPNAKVSVFIPLTDEDALNPKISAAYPYKNPRDVNENGKRYNLLPRVATQDGETGLYSPAQPFGSFPTKEEFITNSTLLQVYEKYYKYTTVTNQSGDYMIFGAPTGLQTIHLSVDITDIGRFSMTPATLVNNLGFSPNLFINNGTRIKPSNDLADLPNIETQEISVDIIPFCGDEENFDIGITRQDFRIRAELVNTFIIFGTSMTPPRDGFWNDFVPNDNTPNPEQLPELYKFKGEIPSLVERNNPTSFRVGRINETIMYIPPSITDVDSDNYNFDPQNELVVLPKSLYSKTTDSSGNFIYQIQCNRKKIITSETGVDIEVPFDNVNGVFTEFRGLMLCEITLEELNVDSFTVENATGERIYRSKFRIPQAFHSNVYKPINNSTEEERNPKEYLGKHKIFKGNEIYSVSQFIATERVVGSFNNFVPNVNNNNPINDFADQVTGNIILSKIENAVTVNTSSGMIKTGQVRNLGSGLLDIFSGEWLNFCLFFHQWGVIKDDNNKGGTLPYLTPLLFFVETDQGGGLYDDFWIENTNNEPIGAGLRNNHSYVSPTKIPLDFIRVTKEDLIKINTNINNRGFRFNDILDSSSQTKETRMFTGQSTVRIDNQNRRNNTFSDSSLADTGFGFNNFDIPTNTSTNDPYFFKGIGVVDIISFLNNLNVLS